MPSTMHPRAAVNLPPTNSPTPERKMLRAKEIAARYGIGESTVWLWAKQGKLKPLRLGYRLTLFPVDQLEALFAASSPSATE